MPARPLYFHRLNEALLIFQALETDWIDRRTLEKALAVSKTVAWRILRQCGARDGPGNTIVCRREELIATLEQLQKTGHYQQEMRRRRRVEEYLFAIAQLAHLKRTGIAADQEAVRMLNSRLRNLPAGIELTRNRLGIDFDGPADFLAKLGALVFALQNDYDAVLACLGEGTAPASASSLNP
jgi:hypothetical protein